MYWEEKKKEKEERIKQIYEKFVSMNRARSWISLISLFYQSKHLEKNMNVKRWNRYQQNRGIYIWQQWKKRS